MNLLKRKISDLIVDNHDYAAALFHMGIQFFDYDTETLEQVCRQRGLNLAQVIRNLESVHHADQQIDSKLLAYPTDLIIEYLRHAHYLFIKRDLPFIARLIDNADPYLSFEHDLISDMKTVFPLFAEDFVHHIYEEEDTLFSYIQLLHKARKGKVNYARLFYTMEKLSIQQFAVEHEMHEDEMNGMRIITDNYSVNKVGDLKIKVLLNELRLFEEKLNVHAKVENDILFPKAIRLEQEVKDMWTNISRYN